MKTGNPPRLCLIVPTKDRPFELERLFRSIQSQNILPAQIIIVDGGEPGIKWLADKYSDLKIDYLQVLPPGLTRQRNAGLKRVGDDIDLIAFLDDDIVLEPGCLENMLDFWTGANDDTGGAGFNIIDHPPTGKPRWLEFLFSLYLKNKPAGALLKTGRNMPYCPASATTETQWLCGGATVWRKEIFSEFDYDEWFAGYGIVEDVDFSYRVSRKYKLFVAADSQVRHIETSKKNHYLQAYVVTMNHLYLSKKHAEFSYPLCLAYFMTNGARCLLSGILFLNKFNIKKGMGIINASLRASILGISRVQRQVKDKK
ncbi:MAG: glycosyltransferase [Thermodesulfovibrionia bacterium]|nr:glycosyltransferase [Thermodesulfovibrionia bacterium]